MAAPKIAWEWLDDEAEPACDLAFSASKSASSVLRVAFDAQDDANFYALECDAARATFSITQKGVRRVLGSAPVVWNPKNALVLQRRPWMMQLLRDGRPVLRAFDATWSEGQIGFAKNGWKSDDARLQPVEAIRFDDDFTRAGAGGDNLWKVAGGKWELSAASEQVSAKNADMSANPFAWVSQKGEALATAGRWFWDSYDLRVAVRPNAAGEVGVAVYVQDPKNYLAFKWGSSGANARRLVLVRNGRESVLASAPGAFVPRVWSQIGIRTSPGYIEALLDGAPVLRAANSQLGQGGIGLWSKGGGAIWDDVRARSYEFLRADFAGSGAWNGDKNWKLSANSATPLAAPALLTTGKGDWNAYRALMTVQTGNAGAGGLVFGWRDARNYGALRLAGKTSAVPFRGRIQIVDVKNGVAKIISDAPFDPSKATRLSLSVQNGAFAVENGGKTLAQAILPDTRGKFGVMGAQNGISFSDAVIYFAPPPEVAKVATRFANDTFMLGWASAAGQWPPTPGPSGLEFWNTGDLFGDWNLNFPWRANWKGKIEIAVGAARGQFDSGLLLRGEGDGETVNWGLWHGAKALAQGVAKVADLAGENNDENAILHLSQSNRRLILSSAARPILAAIAPPTAGHAMAIRTNGFRVRSELLALSSERSDDFTFSDAPTDFYAPSGLWSVFSRWPCYGDWSFFGGTGRHPVLWTKRTYGGDIVAEYYAHPQMDLPKEPGYSHPGDLNVTLCGDGSNPASGYSFIVAGHDNTQSQILRAGKVVARNDGDNAWFHDAINQNMNWHRTWPYVRAEARAHRQDGKKGVLLTLTLNNEKLAEWFDAQPLPLWNKGGRVAFWTLDSTLMLARAKIEAQDFGAKTVPASLRDTTPKIVAGLTSSVALSTPVAVVENESQTATVARENENWNVVNPVAGGIFAVDLNQNQLKADENSKLSFDFRAAGAKVDAYLQIGDQWLLLPLSGKQANDALAPRIADAPPIAPGVWTPVNFNIGAALAKAFPGQKSWKIEKIRIGALHGDTYRWQGFDGNAVGASYELRGLKWSG